ncbi:ATP-dependent DNA helicase 2 subunit KU70 [Impatiens glandulifera]|uniref:ATP-dependent DNA helicase 2 subunit KU70 n=1 Tax=Impatiens glandulifera TaxID=253017 RepID=UPI001FB087F1|nr:ATP-dependent DNA helicase 2 subunit KU70 [Impatiens glandulifera]
MELDPDEIFRDDEDEADNEFFQGKEAKKELVVYLIDASPKMFSTTCIRENESEETHFHVAINCVAQALKTQIINSSYDEVAICFFNTREKKNLQDLNGVFVVQVPEREDLDRPTAKLIKDFDCVEETFAKQIGSQYGILSATHDNSLYNALWVAQAMLRKGSAKTADKRILLFTNEDDPFGCMKGIAKIDMIRTTLQRAKDAQDLGILIELLPLSATAEEFNVSLFYNELLGLEDGDIAQFLPAATLRFDDIKEQLRKRMFRKRKVKRINFLIGNGISMALDTYALIRPSVPGGITWLDSVTNVPLETERSFVCADTGALVEPAKRFQAYRNENIKFTADELSEIKRVSTGHLRLVGFKPLSCLKDYHNLRPSTFLFPSEEEVIGNTSMFIALHRSMLKFNRYAVAFYGSSAYSRLVALVAQDEIITPGGQVEPPGLHMIYLPYSDDIRQVEENVLETHDAVALQANDDQIQKAVNLMRRIDLKHFTVCQFSNPALQRHYAVLQALALDEDEMPDINDETVPDQEGMSRPAVVSALEEFKHSIFGENYDERDDEIETGGKTGVSKRRKVVAEDAMKESGKYDWEDLADSGKLKHLTVGELKIYLAAHNLPGTGKKEALISRILTHMGK